MIMIYICLSNSINIYFKNRVVEEAKDVAEAVKEVAKQSKDVVTAVKGAPRKGRKPSTRKPAAKK
jgi:hypothetical protein